MTASPTRVVFVLEADSAAAAEAHLRPLPMVAAGLMKIECVELRPFVNWSGRSAPTERRCSRSSSTGPRTSNATGCMQAWAHSIRAGGKTVRRKGAGLVIDGPFAEGREAVLGYFLVRVDNLDEACAIAGESPYAEIGGATEVRMVGALPTPWSASSPGSEALLQKAALGRGTRELEGSAICRACSADIPALRLELADCGGQHRIVLETVVSDQCLERAQPCARAAGAPNRDGAL